MRLLLPVLLAVVAFIGNQLYLMKGQEFVCVSREIETDGTAVFEESDLAKVKVDVRGGKLTGVLWEDRAILHGAVVQRDFQDGELVLLSDVTGAKSDLSLRPGETDLVIPLQGVEVDAGLLNVGRYIAFVVADRSDDAPDEQSSTPKRRLGPFRIVSVGATIEEEGAMSSTAKDQQQRAATIGVAVEFERDGTLPLEASQLVDASKNEAILSVGLYRFDQKFGADAETSYDR